MYVVCVQCAFVSVCISALLILFVLCVVDELLALLSSFQLPVSVISTAVTTLTQLCRSHKPSQAQYQVMIPATCIVHCSLPYTCSSTIHVHIHVCVHAAVVYSVDRLLYNINRLCTGLVG